MITTLTEKCTGCGLCVNICHEDGIALVDGHARIDPAVCSTCTQCIAICPNQALAWDGQSAARFDRLSLPSLDQLTELFQERRSIRRFKPEPVARATLEAIADYGVYAPAHTHDFRAILVDDPALIAILDRSVYDQVRWIYRLIFQPKLIQAIARIIGMSGEMDRQRPKLEGVLELGHVFQSMPTAFILVVAQKKSVLATESAQYMLANMMYAAQVKGVGACLWANGPIFIDKLPKARRALGIKSGERIYGAMYMGYPAVKFSNKVLGRKMQIQWNGGI